MIIIKKEKKNQSVVLHFSKYSISFFCTTTKNLCVCVSFFSFFCM